MSNDSFDPRFDPAFQPGFEGKPAKSRAARPARTVSPAQAALESAREHAEKAPIDSAHADEADELESRRPNPFLIALSAMSLALIAGGLGTLQWIRAQFLEQDIRLNLDYFSLDALKIAAPLAVALGIAIGAGVLFVYAVRWKRPD